MPKYGMVDFDSAEILALEEVFANIDLFQCDFHREQGQGKTNVFVRFVERVI